LALPLPDVGPYALIRQVREHYIAQALLNLFETAAGEKNALGAMAELVALQDRDTTSLTVRMRVAFCSVGSPAAARSISALRRFSYSFATVLLVAAVDSWNRLPWYTNSQT
jgi:hypothetical protein